MGIRVRSIIAASIAVLMYALAKDKENGHGECRRERIMVLRPENEAQLWSGNWVVMTYATQLGNLDLGGEVQNIALLTVSDIESARIAAKLEMKDAESAVFITNSSSDRACLERAVTFHDALDYMIYHQIMLMKHSISSSMLLKHTFERAMAFLVADLVALIC